MLGTQDLGASNMYSNLLMHGKGNHLLSPTDLLQHVYPSAFATIRVEADLNLGDSGAWQHKFWIGNVRITAHGATEVELLAPNPRKPRNSLRKPRKIPSQNKNLLTN